MFANDDDLAAAIEAAAREVEDPLWRMPLWDPYDENLKSNIADLANMANNPMAGCIYGALFLQRFVGEMIPWAHLDTWAWRDPGKPGRPKGGDALGLRAVFAMLQGRYLHR
jgi:leucyl aminopeptidase